MNQISLLGAEGLRPIIARLIQEAQANQAAASAILNTTDLNRAFIGLSWAMPLQFLLISSKAGRFSFDQRWALKFLYAVPFATSAFQDFTLEPEIMEESKLAFEACCEEADKLFRLADASPQSLELYLVTSQFAAGYSHPATRAVLEMLIRQSAEFAACVADDLPLVGVQ